MADPWWVHGTMRDPWYWVGSKMDSWWIHCTEQVRGEFMIYPRYRHGPWWSDDGTMVPHWVHDESTMDPWYLNEFMMDQWYHDPEPIVWQWVNNAPMVPQWIHGGSFVPATVLIMDQWHCDDSLWNLYHLLYFNLYSTMHLVNEITRHWLEYLKFKF